MIIIDFLKNILIYTFNYFFYILLNLFIDTNLRIYPIFRIFYKIFIIIYTYIQSIKYNSNISKVKFKRVHSYAGCMITEPISENENQNPYENPYENPDENPDENKNKYIIQLSDIFIERGSFEEIDNLIKHEIAHQLYEKYKNLNIINNIKFVDFKNPHNKIWKKIFIAIGGNGKTNSKNYTNLSECYKYICKNKFCDYYQDISKYNLIKIRKRNCYKCGKFCSIKDKSYIHQS